MKDKKGGKITTKFAATAPKPFSYCLQKDDHEIEDLIQTIGVKKLLSKELRSSDYEKCVFDS